AHSLGALWQATSCEPWRAQPRCVLDRCFEPLWVEGRHTLDPPQTLDLAIIRLLATSAHALMGKSRLDSPRPGAIYTPLCCVAFGARSNGQEATAKKQRPRSNGQEATDKKQRPRSKGNDRGPT